MNCSARLWSGLDLGSGGDPAADRAGSGGAGGDGCSTSCRRGSPWRVCRWGASWPWRWRAPLPSGSAGCVCCRRIRTVPPSSSSPAGAGSVIDWPSGTTAREIQRDLLPLLLTAESLESRPDLVDTTLTLADEAEARPRRPAGPAGDQDRRAAGTACGELPDPGPRGPGGQVVLPSTGTARSPRWCRGPSCRILERTAHLSPVERPDAVAAAMTAWIAGSTPASSLTHSSAPSRPACGGGVTQQRGRQRRRGQRVGRAARRSAR